ncbi:MAG: gliding motility lipoprotein GldH [Bacteroidetes bacterium]|nr:MAG: gliding motility lipoprotein GldH [Bacteroidota bacterium]
MANKGINKILQIVSGFLILGIISLLFSSCDKNRVFEANVEIPDQTWNMDKAVVFSPSIDDTLSIQSVFVNVRNTSSYPYNNLYLFITTTSPSGQWILDTLDLQLADKRGKWLGSGLGDIFFNRRIFKQRIRFPMEGAYTFEIRQGMRSEDLKGIRDVGLRIEKSE